MDSPSLEQGYLTIYCPNFQAHAIICSRAQKRRGKWQKKELQRSCWNWLGQFFFRTKIVVGVTFLMALSGQQKK